MAVLRTFVAVVVTVTCTEAALQQPPRDGQPLRQSSGALITQAHEHYRAQQWERAVEKYEAALAENPQQFNAWFFLANSYDNLYRPGRAGEPANDRNLAKAVEHYRTAAERDPDPKMRKRAMEYLVAAYGPEKLNDPSMAEPIVQRMIQDDPAELTNYLALAKIYEDHGRYEEAEQTLHRARAVAPRNTNVYTSLAGFYNRQGDFPKTMEALQQAAALEPDKAEPHQRVAVFYWEKAFRDQRLSQEQKREYVQAGIAATDRALAIDPDYIDALTYKNILLRMQANQEADRTVQAQLLQEADALRNRAIELSKQRSGRRPGGSTGTFAAPPPPPPPPPPGSPEPSISAPVRVGGNIPTPTKIKHVAPAYPDAALQANVQGVVIIEAIIDTAGRIGDARVLRSIPLLDEAALEAVRQWEFTPTYLNGVAVPVIMTVTVNFSRQ